MTSSSLARAREAVRSRAISRGVDSACWSSKPAVGTSLKSPKCQLFTRMRASTQTSVSSISSNTRWRQRKRLGFRFGRDDRPRVSDTLVSHWILYFIGYRPNPGILSTPFYLVEAGILALTFRSGLSMDPRLAWTGIIVGTLFFCSVLPGLALVGWLFPCTRHDRWQRGGPLPEWAIP